MVLSYCRRSDVAYPHRVVAWVSPPSAQKRSCVAASLREAPARKSSSSFVSSAAAGGRRGPGRQCGCERQRENRDQHAPTPPHARGAAECPATAQRRPPGARRDGASTLRVAGTVAACSLQPVSAEATCSPARTARNGSRSSPLPRARGGSVARAAGAPSTCHRSAARRQERSFAACGRSPAAYLPPIASARAPCATN